MEHITTTQNRVADARLNNLFEVEELEQRLETAEWTASTTVETGPDGTTCTSTVSCKL